MHINFLLESMGCYPLETFASQAADCRGGGVFCNRQDVDSLILGGSVSFENFGALCALNKAALEQLTMASSLWKDTWVQFLVYTYARVAFFERSGQLDSHETC